MLSQEQIEALSELPFIEKLNKQKAQLDAMRPLLPDLEGRVMQKLRLEWNYHSNAIEGNSLSLGETKQLLMYGVTAKGKPLKDHLDIKGHNEAIEFLLGFVGNQETLTEVDIRNLHQIVLDENNEVDAETPDGRLIKKTIRAGQYKTLPNHVKTVTGEIHYYATPEETPIRMQALMDWYKETKEAAHPVVLATLFHHEFVAIHPFDDGNGRIARMLMNLILMQGHFPPSVVKQEKRQEYYMALQSSDAGEYLPFLEFIAETVSDALDIYLRGAKGESIEEPDDVDKEIALFKIELKGKEVRVQRSVENQFIQISNLVLAIDQAFTSFCDLFADYAIYVENYGQYNMLYHNDPMFETDVLRPFINDIEEQQYHINFELSNLYTPDLSILLKLKLFIKATKYKLICQFIFSLHHNDLIDDYFLDDDRFRIEPVTLTYEGKETVFLLLKNQIKHVLLQTIKTIAQQTEYK
jgi:Fic family protein